MLTYVSYTLYHVSRKAPSIVKTTLIGQGGWSPFDTANGTALFGRVDLAFLLSYAAGMLFCGHLADRVALRGFLSLGMLLSGLSVMSWGLLWAYELHDIRCEAPVSATSIALPLPLLLHLSSPARCSAFLATLGS